MVPGFYLPADNSGGKSNLFSLSSLMGAEKTFSQSLVDIWFGYATHVGWALFRKYHMLNKPNF